MKKYIALSMAAIAVVFSLAACTSNMRGVHTPTTAHGTMHGTTRHHTTHATHHTTRFTVPSTAPGAGTAAPMIPGTPGAGTVAPTAR